MRTTMYEKLVKLHLETSYFTEIDPEKIKRVAATRKNYILQHVDPTHDEWDIRKEELPLCNAALRGAITSPIDTTKMPLLELQQSRLEFPARQQSR